MTSGRTVEELVVAAGHGDGAAWEALVDRYAPLVWAVARGHGLDVSTAVDVAQTCWLRLAEHLGDIAPDAVGAWLAASARQEARRAARWVLHVDLTAATGESAGGEVWRALSSLPPRCRLTLRLLALPTAPSDLELVAALDVAPESLGSLIAQCVDRLARALSSPTVPAAADEVVP